MEIRELRGVDGRRWIAGLAEVLLDCVAGGASVSFMASLTPAEAETFFGKALDGVERGERIGGGEDPGAKR